jgi:hypothetical protein
MNVRVGALTTVRIPFSIKERPRGCVYCHSRTHRTYFAYGRLLHVFCNKDCMLAHQLQYIMQENEEPK